MMHETGQQNMPAFSHYEGVSISRLIKEREIGLSKNSFQTLYKSTKNNPYSDLEMIRSMLCDKQAYLETIACRKISRSKSPAFCHGRLFTDNYQTWFNLFTGPTSGPLLMTSDLFKVNDLSNKSAVPPMSQKKVVDVTCIFPPNNCKPPSNLQWVGPCIVLLTKSGWVYEADLESCKIISKTYIPTKEYTSNLCDSPMPPKQNAAYTTLPPPEALPSYSYCYVYCNKECESLVVKSAKVYHSSSQTSSFAFCMFFLYPLRLHCHFIVTVKSRSQSSPITPDITDDMLILNLSRASNIQFYDLHDVISEHDLGSSLSLNEKVNVKTPNGLHRSRAAIVGHESVGIPYTMRNISLHTNRINVKSPCLFKTAAMRHCMQIGGCPYHYLVPINKAGTLWTVKHFADDSEVLSGRLKLKPKWNSSHWHSIRFLCDDGDSRIIKQDCSSIEVYSIQHEQWMDCDIDNIPGTSNVDTSKFGCRLLRDFVIDLQPVACSSLSSNSLLPPLPPHTVTVYGRVVRRPRVWSVAPTVPGSVDEDGHLLVGVDFDVELHLFVVLHYRPIGHFSTGWETKEGCSELVVSLFDSYNAKYLRSFVLDSDTSPSDRDVVGVSLDQDTFIYTRLRANDDRIQYKILRLNRKYGSD